MGTSKGSTPPPPTPDPFATSFAQTGSNVNTAVANSYLSNANETSPYGSVNYTQTGSHNVGGFDVPSWQRDVTLSPEQQHLADQQQALGMQMNDTAGDELSRVSGILGSPIDTNSLPGRVDSINPSPTYGQIGNGPTSQKTYDSGGNIGDVNLGHYNENTWDFLTGNANQADQYGNFGQTAGNVQYNVGPNDFSQDRNAVESALFQRLNPQLDQRRASLENQLTNQGFSRGSDAWNKGMDDFNREANDARLDVTARGLGEQQGLFGMALNKGQFNNAAQNQDFSQQQARGSFLNQAIGQNNASHLAASQFQNATMAQREKMIQDFFNQQNNTTLQQQQFNNSAQGQRNAQNQQAASFYNQGAQQDYANQIGATQYNNAMGQQGWNDQQQAATFQNTARERALQEMLAVRNQPLNEISTLMNGGQVQMPQFTQFRPGQVAPTDVSGNVFNAANINAGNWRTQQQANAQAMGGLYGLGGTALQTAGRVALSDIRVKYDITSAGTLPNGLKAYVYRYVDDDALQIGVMAHEVEAVMPEAVITLPSGYKAVRYDMVWN